MTRGRKIIDKRLASQIMTADDAWTVFSACRGVYRCVACTEEFSSPEPADFCDEDCEKEYREENYSYGITVQTNL